MRRAMSRGLPLRVGEVSRVASHSAKACSTTKLMDRPVALAMVRIAETTREVSWGVTVVPGTEGRRFLSQFAQASITSGGIGVIGYFPLKPMQWLSLIQAAIPITSRD